MFCSPSASVFGVLTGGGGGEEFNTRAQRSEKIELRFRSGSWPIPFFRALALAHALARREERRGRRIQHKGTRAQRTQRSEKIELRFRSGSWPIPFFRALALSLALDRREERRGIQHKGTRAQRTQSSEDVWLLGAGTRTAAFSVSTELSPKRPL